MQHNKDQSRLMKVVIQVSYSIPSKNCVPFLFLFAWFVKGGWCLCKVWHLGDLLGSVDERFCL